VRAGVLIRARRCWLVRAGVDSAFRGVRPVAKRAGGQYLLRRTAVARWRRASNPATTRGRGTDQLLTLP